MKKMIPVLICMSILAGDISLTFASDFVGCVKVSQDDQESGKVECFEVFKQNDIQNFKNIQTIIDGADKADKFRLIKSQELYQLVQFNGDSGCLSVHRMTFNLEKLETFSIPCGLVSATDVEGSVDQKGNLFLALSGHDAQQNFLGKLTVVKMSPQGEFRIFPVLLNTTIHHPETFLNIKIAVSSFSNTVNLSYVAGGVGQDFGDLHIASIDSTSGAIKGISKFNFKVSADPDNVQLVANHLGQTFAVMSGIDENGIQGVYALREGFSDNWDAPVLIRRGVQRPRLTALGNELVYLSSTGVENNAAWLDIISSQSGAIINSLSYPDPAKSGSELDDSLVLKGFHSGTKEATLIGLEEKI